MTIGITLTEITYMQQALDTHAKGWHQGSRRRRRRRRSAAARGGGQRRAVTSARELLGLYFYCIYVFMVILTRQHYVEVKITTAIVTITLLTQVGRAPMNHVTFLLTNDFTLFICFAGHESNRLYKEGSRLRLQIDVLNRQLQ